jgi:RNA polymerase sigma-70 factor (ECF subfamily)
MASTVQSVMVSEQMAFLPTFAQPSVNPFKSIYEENRHRVYAIAFWMTDSELQAEQLLETTFVSAFAKSDCPTEEDIDNELIAQLREDHNIGTLTLKCADATEVLNIRSNTKRVHLELAVVQLPATEKLMFLMHDVEGYDHVRIARTLGVTEQDSKQGLHQSRLRIRELVGKMAW